MSFHCAHPGCPIPWDPSHTHPALSVEDQRLIAGAKAHMENIPPSDAHWPEKLVPQHKYERVGTLSECFEARRGWHYAETGGDTCILCGRTLGQSRLRQPVSFVSVPAGQADLACDGLPLGYGTGIPFVATVVYDNETRKVLGTFPAQTPPAGAAVATPPVASEPWSL